MTVARPVRRLLLVGTVAAALFLPAARASTSPFPESGTALDLLAVESRLPEAPRDPLVPFHLHLSASIADVRRVTSAQIRGELRTERSRYVHLGLEAADALDDAAFRGPAGLPVLDGDFFFQDGELLVEASFLVESPGGADEGREVLRRTLGDPSFRVQLPNGTTELIGWRTVDGYLIATFSDLPIFRVSAFPDRRADVFAGSQILLFEGLQRFHDRLAAGESASSLLGDLMRVFAGATSARSELERIR